MKFMEKAKRFFTLKRRANDGFTLVELIVVIAILAILAGVAVPAYSGYIKKAEKAGDLQIVGAINEAFQAACMVQNLDARQITGATLAWTGKCVTGVASASGANVDATQLNTDFLMFFAGNTTTEFKVLDGKLAFRGGLFGDAATNFESSYNGNPIFVSGKNVEAYLNSNWGDVATSDVLSLVGATTDFAGTVDNTVFLGMLGSKGYLNAAAAALGVDPEDYDATVTAMIEDGAAKWATENNITDEEQIEAYKETLGGQIMTNNAVLVAAKNAEANKDEIIDLLTKDNGTGAKKAIADAMSTSPADGLAQASLAYGLYTSYMLDKDPDFDTSTNPDPLTVMRTLEDPGFQTYLKSDDAQKDLDGFMGALNTAASNTGNGIGQDIVQNGFVNNSELAGLLQSALGK